MSGGPSPQVLLRKDARGACRGTRANAVRSRLSCVRPRGAPPSRSTASGLPPAGARKKTHLAALGGNGADSKSVTTGLRLRRAVPARSPSAAPHRPSPIPPARAAHVALHRVVSHVAVPPWYLDRPGVVHPHDGRRGQELCHRGLGAARPALVLQVPRRYNIERAASSL